MLWISVSGSGGTKCFGLGFKSVLLMLAQAQKGSSYIMLIDLGSERISFLLTFFACKGSQAKNVNNVN